MSWKNKYPFTDQCQALDAQISSLRNLKSDVSLGKNKNVGERDIYNFLAQKEIQFARSKCSLRLENSSVYGSVDILRDRFVSSEDRIIGEGNKRKNTMLITGGVVLVVGLFILIR